MIKVLLVAPYSGMAEVAKNLTLPDDIFLEITVANLEESIKAAKAAESEGFDVIISRGGTASLLQEAVSIPVVHIGITGYDMLRVFTLIRGIKQGVALVGYKNITDGAATICNILEYDIHRITIHNREEVRTALEELKKDGYSVVIGDVVTVQFAEMTGLRGILITSGREALLDAIDASREMHRQLKQITSQNRIIHDAFHSLPCPVLLTHTDGQPIESNATFQRKFQQFQLKDHPGLKKAVTSVAEDGTGRWARVVTEGQTYDVEIFLAGKKDNSIGLLFQNAEKQTSSAILIQGQITHRPIPGESDYAKQLRTTIKKYATATDSVWISGEHGSGKNTVARILHFERFGLESPAILIAGKQASPQDIEGLKQAIHTGSLQKTLIIDSPEYLQPAAQESLFSLLQTYASAVYPITISERPLASFTEGSFDKRLYKLLSKNPLHLAALREREEDIPAYIDYFLAEFHAENGSNILGIRRDALEFLQSYHWPGNIHQLKQAIKELSLTAPGNFIELEQVKALIHQYKSAESQPTGMPLNGTLEEMEQRIIRQVLAEEDNNQSKAAVRLGINRSTLWRKLKS